MDRKSIERYRLSLFGRMVAGVAHEVDNHLSVILGFAELIQIGGGADGKAAEGAERILSAGEKVGTIMRHFSHHARPHDPVEELFVPGEAISEILAVARYDLARGSVTLDLPDGFPRGLARGDRRDFAYAVLSLLFNGAEAMAGKGGTLGLAVSVRGKEWEVAVTDEGPGIPPALVSRVFEEGFTTRKEPIHSGLGLPAARHIAARMGGTVTVANRPEGGCVARLTVPVFQSGPVKEGSTP